MSSYEINILFRLIILDNIWCMHPANTKHLYNIYIMLETYIKYIVLFI